MLRYFVLLLIALFGANATVTGDSCLLKPYLTRAGYKTFDFTSGTTYSYAVPDGVGLQGICRNGEFHNLVCSDGVWYRMDNPNGSTKIGCNQ
ncbi:unnamed protein product [Heligmosomoides polygyrus]|uniref:Sushi domain-containing protein n=1 Tax=Heligmosomoides polygyrus TaxID=6339 RepID=A0A183FZB9_HELPZ|nr:unnamed protein product [Heligmosomoides polygyrus]